MQETSRWWRNRWEAAGWILLVALLIGFAPLVLFRTTQRTSTDFWQFHHSAQQLWQHGLRAPDSKFSHYVPSVDVAFGLVAWMPVFWAAAAWLGIMTFAWLCLLAAVRRYLLTDYDATVARQAVLAVGLLMLPLFIDHLCVGAFHVLMVWLLVAGLGRVSQGCSWSGGLMLGLAIWIKLLPIVGVGYLLLKRKWLSAAVAVAAAVLIDLGLSLAAFGPVIAWQSHCRWWNDEARGVQNRMLTDAHPLDDDRVNNQSTMIVMRHFLTHMGHGTAADRAKAAPCGVPVMPWEVGSVDFGGFRPNVAVADLTAGQLQTAYAAAMFLLVLAVVIYCRRPGRKLLPRQWSIEIALVVLATLWFTPYVWSYHELAALPALAVIVAQDPRRPKVARATIALWIISLALMGSHTARALGMTLWTNLLLGVILVTVTAKTDESGEGNLESNFDSEAERCVTGDYRSA